MALLTGDIKGKLGNLRSSLVHIRCPHILDEEKAAKGLVHELIPIIFYALHRFSRHVASLAGAVELGGRRGKNYLQGVLKFVREEFGISSGVTISQWLSEGYAERKLIFIHRLIVACQEYHKHASRQHRLEQLKTKRGRQGASERPATEPLLDRPTSSGRIFEKAELPEERDTVRFDDAYIEQRCLEFINGAQPGMEFSPVAQPAVRPRTPPDCPRHLPEALQESMYYPQPLEKNADTSTTDVLNTQGVSLWLAALSQQVEQLQIRAQRADDSIKKTSLSTAMLQSNTEAHLRVLEGRVLGLERRWTAPIPFAVNPTPPTASDNQPHHNDQLPIYDNTDSTPLFREYARKDTCAPATCHHQGAVVDAPNSETSIDGTRQRWVKWNSPTACFNPLYVQPISIVDNTTSSPSNWATPPPANPTAGSPAFPSSSPCHGLHPQDVKHAPCSNETGMGDLLSCLNARLDDANRLLAQVRRTMA